MFYGFTNFSTVWLYHIVNYHSWSNYILVGGWLLQDISVCLTFCSQCSYKVIMIFAIWAFYGFTNGLWFGYPILSTFIVGGPYICGVDFTFHFYFLFFYFLFLFFIHICKKLQTSSRSNIGKIWYWVHHWFLLISCTTICTLYWMGDAKCCLAVGGMVPFV